MGYDRVSTVFSPDGKLFQVQYAMEAVKRGATVVGLVCKNSVVLVADRRINTSLMVADSIEKIYKVDDHLAIATSGLVADGRKLVDEARMEAQRNKILYGEPADTVNVVRFLSDMGQVFTQYAGLRPFGVSVLVAGVNSNPRLFEADPSGTPTEWRATAIGEGRVDIMEFLEKEYSEGLATETGVDLALRALSKVMKKKIEADKIELMVVSKEGVKKLSGQEIDKYLGKLKK